MGKNPTMELGVRIIRASPVLTHSLTFGLGLLPVKTILAERITLLFPLRDQEDSMKPS